jgi:hypothetical protein
MYEIDRVFTANLKLLYSMCQGCVIAMVAYNRHVAHFMTQLYNWHICAGFIEWNRINLLRASQESKN